MGRLRAVGQFLWDLIGAFVADDCPRMAAALSYSSVLAMPAILGTLALVARHLFESADVRRIVAHQVGAVVGVESATRIVTAVEAATRPDLLGPMAVVGLIGLLFAATGSFSSLQGALNRAWSVQPDPKRSDVKNFLMRRAISLVMLAALGVLILVSAVASTALSALQGILGRLGPDWLQSWLVMATDTLVSLVAISLLTAVVLRWVPDAVVKWRDALAGGLFTGLLFTVGKVLIGYYLGRRHLGNVYGAAASLAIALLWIYFTAVALLLGAEFTEAWARRRGDPVVPQPGAVRVERRIVYEDEHDPKADDAEVEDVGGRDV